ncbi:helix-turn-helix transcriptional regulator [Cellulosimicrobium marinum]|uniref:helix-turn-helix transcriptional regulator n=1 Tax=Cellulosimicrobium marinum TaxID=1638992 RepID=UPI001E597BB8|nr:helix-turn-helix transcriptional regulator [Cellulosimicrobium marinum]MCB7137455.1 helix-turn-helix transcriptional regulator [Cellulosimicrobium marinum]
MTRSTPSSADIVVLRDVLDLAQVSRHAPSTAVVAEILRRLERLLDSDGVAFHAMDARDFSLQHEQGVEAGQEYEVAPSDVEQWSPDDGDDGMGVLVDHWWVSPCSLIERTGTAVATSIRSWYGERRWSEHPVHREYLVVDDELILGYPLGGARSLRLLAPRASGSPFGERELTICRLLLPHLRDVLTAVAAPSTDRARTPDALTGRQREIVQLVEIGMSNKEIGAALGISAATVRTHLEHVYARLGATSRTAAVASAGLAPTAVPALDPV